MHTSHNRTGFSVHAFLVALLNSTKTVSNFRNHDFFFFFFQVGFNLPSPHDSLQTEQAWRKTLAPHRGEIHSQRFDSTALKLSVHHSPATDIAAGVFISDVSIVSGNLRGIVQMCSPDFLPIIPQTVHVCQDTAAAGAHADVPLKLITQQSLYKSDLHLSIRNTHLVLFREFDHFGIASMSRLSSVCGVKVGVTVLNYQDRHWSSSSSLGLMLQHGDSVLSQ